MSKKSILLLLFSLTACTGQPAPITSFEECVAAGNPVMESYPERCSAGGETFVRDIGNALEKQDHIVVADPRPGQRVSGTIEVRGEARGYWYFEATFPIELVSESGQVLAQTFATAQDDWMTEDFVPFVSLVTLPAHSVGPATLVLKRDNPSGLPENDDELTIPILLE